MFKGSEYVYYAMYLVGFAIMMILNVKTCDRKRIPRKKAVMYTLATYAAGVIGALIMGKLYTATTTAAGASSGSRVAIFGAILFTPLLMYLFFLATGNDRRQYLDFITPGIFIILTCAKLGCFLNGCCAGFICDFGIFNPTVGAKVFPVQILEVLTMLPVIALSLFLPKHKRYVRGMAYPASAALYCVIRFFWEFARYYESDKLRHLVVGMTFWQCCCILVLAVSLIFLGYLNSDKCRQKDLRQAQEKKNFKKQHRRKKHRS